MKKALALLLVALMSMTLIFANGGSETTAASDGPVEIELWYGAAITEAGPIPDDWIGYDILLKADRMSMANSLELRVPFLDKKMLELSCRIPSRYRADCQSETTKRALRSAALDAGACAFMISGSGSTMLAVADGDEAAGRVSSALAETCPGYWLRALAANTLGTTVEVH